MGRGRVLRSMSRACVRLRAWLELRDLPRRGGAAGAGRRRAHPRPRGSGARPVWRLDGSPSHAALGIPRELGAMRDLPRRRGAGPLRGVPLRTLVAERGRGQGRYLRGLSLQSASGPGRRALEPPRRGLDSGRAGAAPHADRRRHAHGRAGESHHRLGHSRRPRRAPLSRWGELPARDLSRALDAGRSPRAEDAVGAPHVRRGGDRRRLRGGSSRVSGARAGRARRLRLLGRLRAVASLLADATLPPETAGRGRARPSVGGAGHRPALRRRASSLAGELSGRSRTLRRGRRPRTGSLRTGSARRAARRPRPPPPRAPRPRPKKTGTRRSRIRARGSARFG